MDQEKEKQELTPGSFGTGEFGNSTFGQAEDPEEKKSSDEREGE